MKPDKCSLGGRIAWFDSDTDVTIQKRNNVSIRGVEDTTHDPNGWLRLKEKNGFGGFQCSGQL
jgi:hypothetical protein